MALKGNACIYFPYKDPYLVSAQVLSVLAFAVSWVWFATTSVSFLAMALFQGLWFCRQEKCSILFYSLLAIGAAALAIFTGIHILNNWEDSSFCIPFFMVSQNNDPDYTYNCNEQKYAYISFACGGIWVLAALAMLAFVVSGNYDVWERKYTARARDDSDSDSEDGSGAITKSRQIIVNDQSSAPMGSSWMMTKSRQMQINDQSSAPLGSSWMMTTSRQMQIDQQGSGRSSMMKKQPSVAAMMIAESIANSSRSRGEQTADSSSSGGAIPVATPVPQPAYVGSERGRMDSYV